MNSVESAASLFESDDAGPDPFAVLGDEAETTTTQPNNDVHGETLSGFDNHDPGAAAAGLFASEDSQYTESGPTSQDPYTYDASAYSQDASNSASYNGQQVQGWYDEHGQWQTNQY